MAAVLGVQGRGRTTFCRPGRLRTLWKTHHKSLEIWKDFDQRTRLRDGGFIARIAHPFRLAEFGGGFFLYRQISLWEDLCGIYIPAGSHLCLAYLLVWCISRIAHLRPGGLLLSEQLQLESFDCAHLPHSLESPPSRISLGLSTPGLAVRYR